jgi:SAM-dependent methyltransferase
LLHIDVDRYEGESAVGHADITENVRKRYAQAAASVKASCCEPECSAPSSSDAFDTSLVGDFGTWLYESSDLADIPDGAALASLGCGNPTAVASLANGETVLDLGSGAGIDVLLSAQRVGPDGFVYGIDMTEEMLSLAREHQAEAGVTNVEFRKGMIEDIPLDDAAVDVVISNCVINLSADKPAVIAEMYRVLRPGGRIAISDVVADNELSVSERLERGSWVGCIAGALSFDEYAGELADSGFVDISIESTHAVADGMHSATVRATKRL